MNVSLLSLSSAYRKKNLEENQVLIQKKLEAEENYSVLQEKVTFLFNVQVYEIQRKEDALEMENERLKNKINHEQLLRTKLEEDLRLIQLEKEEITD